jgi:AraC-like DNA-binding protein
MSVRHTSYGLDMAWRLLLKDLGVNSTNVMRRAQLPEDLLSRPSARLEAEDFHAFWSGLEAELRDPHLPLTLCRSIRSESFSPPLFAALCSPHLHMAAQRLARYKALVAPMRLVLLESSDALGIELLWSVQGCKPPDSLLLTELLFFVTLARMGTRERVRPLSVSTPTLPQDLHAYTDFLGVRMQQGSTNRVVFAKSDALRPFLTSNDGLWAAFEPELRTRLAQLDASVSVGQRVRSALLEALPGGTVEMQSVAQKLGMSRRSLQRHLEGEGLTFKDVLQNTRYALAQHYLLKTDLPAAQIAFLLGFEESNSFFRAFRLWTGRTPDELRRSSPNALVAAKFAN